MVKENLLIIEDDPDIVELMQYNLEREGYRVMSAEDGEVGLREAAQRKPDLVLLDLMLPGIDGLSVCRELKQAETTRQIPVIMVTAKGEETDVVTGLELGADDYVVKPFSPRELVARVRAVLRRGVSKEKGSGGRIDLGEVTLDSERYEVRVNDEVVPFTRSEFRLLATLASSPGRVFTRDQLVDQLTDGQAIIIDRNVDVHISAIRKKLGSASDLIVTVRGVGYKCRD